MIFPRFSINTAFLKMSPGPARIPGTQRPAKDDALKPDQQTKAQNFQTPDKEMPPTGLSSSLIMLVY